MRKTKEMTHRREWQELDADQKQERRDELQTKTQPPASVAVNVLAAVADPVGDDKSDTDHLLRESDDEATDLVVPLAVRPDDEDVSRVALASARKE